MYSGVCVTVAAGTFAGITALSLVVDVSSEADVVRAAAFGFVVGAAARQGLRRVMA